MERKVTRREREQVIAFQTCSKAEYLVVLAIEVVAGHLLVGKGALLSLASVEEEWQEEVLQ